ncbi:carbohydrate ABC transporter permease [Halanaerobium congolense]|uniref:carbohydrate ABC transporter permease n=1 Tax=Halanaerobium congolense TaxID=54121 RepID=UPI00088D8E21|nr:sugar ABC transporter permease [Halanaerobium congolense]PUU87083.1 MAG: putative permease component of ABC transporter [Halanaerobium sp.]SDK67114.1 carbohydrate ABC transporter membrane protein 1, CUT1 family [Halanaerobium congolense]SDM34209.1 carbohydrate ABC transporter membrane protein 1, CUT1 family [Halanaerobium congolense]
MNNKNIFSYILISPLLIIMIALVFYPAVLTIIDSLYSIDLVKPQQNEFVGLSNFKELLTSSTILKVLSNSMKYFLLAVTLELFGGIIISLILRRNFVGRGIILSLILLPWALPPVVNAVIWKWIYHPDFGFLNNLLSTFSLIDGYQVWLAKPNLSLILIAVVHVWKILPLFVIIILAQLQTISKELYEAAKIDGASSFQEFTKITLPLLKPAIVIALTQGTFFVMNLFDEVFVLNGLALDTRTLLMQNYLIAFRQLKLSKGMALSLIVAIIILTLTISYIIFIGKE